MKLSAETPTGEIIMTSPKPSSHTFWSSVRIRVVPYPRGPVMATTPAVSFFSVKSVTWELSAVSSSATIRTTMPWPSRRNHKIQHWQVVTRQSVFGEGSLRVIIFNSKSPYLLVRTQIVLRTEARDISLFDKRCLMRLWHIALVLRIREYVHFQHLRGGRRWAHCVFKLSWSDSSLAPLIPIAVRVKEDGTDLCEPTTG